MAPRTAADTGQGLLRDIQGVCDLCGDDCYPNEEICTALACTYNKCDCEVYHQACLEKYLKSHRLASDRKTGFACPRGFSKDSKSSERCRGKIEKSHPIVPKNEKKAKAKAVAPQVLLAQQAEVTRAEAVKLKQAQQAAAAVKKKQQLPGLVPRKAPPASRITPAVVRATPIRPEPEPEAEERGPKELPPGMTLEMALSKAQRKNLRKKTKAKAAEGASEAGTAITEDSAGEAADFGPGAGAGGGADDAASGGGASGSGGGGCIAATIMGTNAFVRDLDSYNRLLGLYMGDSDEEEEEQGEEEAAGSDAGGGGSAAGTGPAPSESGSAAWGAPPLAPAEGGEAALAHAVEESARAAQLGLARELDAERAALEAFAAQRAASPAPPSPVAAPAFSIPIPVPIPVPAPAPAPAPVPIPMPVPVPVPTPAYAYAPAPLPPPPQQQAGALPPGLTRHEAAQRLVGRMFDAPALTDLAMRFLEEAECARLAAAAESAYPDLVAAISRGDAAELSRIVDAGGVPAPAPAAAAAAPAAPAYVAPHYVSVPPAAPHAYAAPAAALAVEAGGEEDLDDLLALCGVEA
ncbi:hypothetical protein Rsub_04974 [Raphidocelis subcapitata]|uniref:Uncharacterized protein n=1 Tax=Raphidocelis subcapitata TaxID=307507 RepID=A0A2V0NX03_9CHLO|nr:hypothetical protein Rsub_04974 [Raphidocelis subcapitata]|eukprot:GBF91869.1 hypothetical protein Rsub_04974 [Raphidocelis subcapitata]